MARAQGGLVVTRAGRGEDDNSSPELPHRFLTCSPWNRRLDHPSRVAASEEEVEEERARIRRRLREEQDAEYQATLVNDQERDYRRQQKALRAARKKEEEKAAALVAKAAADKEAALESRRCHKFAVLSPEPDPGSNITRVRIRLPNGEHRERRFHSSATVQTIYDFVDSIVCFDVLAYNLVSNFPLIVYTPSTHNCTLKDIALHPHASLFVQVDDDDAAAPTAADDDDNDDS
ncbi:unnamed protein product [Sphagnum jensenii]|uniref:UBX domain-containing protein n=1 Tax=Sphagnum jensenii TaxID=128206 RepID=A0ABP0WIR3_9BRYO